MIPTILLAACGTETGNPEATFELEYNARTSDADAVAIEAGNGAIVDAVWLRIDAVELDGCDGDAASAPALGWADHSGVDAAAQSVTVPDVPYCSVSTLFYADQAATGEPPEVQGAAVGLTGTLGDGRAFVVVVDDDVPIELELADEPPPADGAWLLSFDVATWLDVAALEAEVGDPIVVDGDVGRIVEGVQLHVDVDADGVVGPSDRQIDR